MGRDIAYDCWSCDLICAASSPDAYRINLEQVFGCPLSVGVCWYDSCLYRGKRKIRKLSSKRGPSKRKVHYSLLSIASVFVFGVITIQK